MNRRLQELINKGKIPNKGGVFIDAYNQSVNEDIAGTITTRVNASSGTYVTEPSPTKIIPLNIDKDGNCCTIKAGYYKMVGANFLGHTNDGFKATCIMEVKERDTKMKENYIKPIIIDDYNQRIPKNQDVIGTVTTNIGNSTPRNGYKIVEGVSVRPHVHAFEFKGKQSIKQDAAPCLRAVDCKGPHCVWEKSTSYRIRKLTPRECFRLMDVTEDNIDKIQATGLSNTQQYKMCGNSIVVDVMVYILKNLFSPENGNITNKDGQLSLS